MCLHMRGNCLTNQRPGSGRNSVKHSWPKIFQAWGVSQRVGPPNFSPILWAVCLQMHGNCSMNQWPHQISNYNVVWSMFFCKCSETAGPTRGQEVAGIRWSMTKSYSGLGRAIMHLPTKFEPNLISGWSANAWKLFDQSEVRELRIFCEA